MLNRTSMRPMVPTDDLLQAAVEWDYSDGCARARRKEGEGSTW